MKEVDVGSTKCKGQANSNDIWWLPRSWDDAQNCLAGCISRMNERNGTEACCQYQDFEEKGKGACVIYYPGDVVPGDENSSALKAVKCRGTLGLFKSDDKISWH